MWYATGTYILKTKCLRRNNSFCSPILDVKCLINFCYSTLPDLNFLYQLDIFVIGKTFYYAPGPNIGIIRKE